MIAIGSPASAARRRLHARLILLLPLLASLAACGPGSGGRPGY